MGHPLFNYRSKCSEKASYRGGLLTSRSVLKRCDLRLDTCLGIEAFRAGRYTQLYAPVLRLCIVGFVTLITEGHAAKGLCRWNDTCFDDSIRVPINGVLQARIFTVFVHFPLLEDCREYLGSRFRDFSQRFYGVPFDKVQFFV